MFVPRRYPDPTAADSAGASLGWVTDTDPQSHPARRLPGHRAGDLLAYHVPRTLFEIGTPAVVHLFVTTVGGRRRCGGILIDRTGAVSPIPLDPDAATPQATAAQLAALALGITEPLHLGRQPKLRNEPPQLTHLAAALATTDHLEIEWETLCGIVRPPPRRPRQPRPGHQAQRPRPLEHAKPALLTIAPAATRMPAAHATGFPSSSPTRPLPAVR